MKIVWFLWCAFAAVLLTGTVIIPDDAILRPIISNIWFWIPFVFLFILLFAHNYLQNISRLKGKITREIGCDEVHFVETDDRWKIALFRYKPKSGFHRNFPVLMVHGLSSNRLVFDLGENTSIARHLSQKGYDVWLLEMRGSNTSHHMDYHKKHNVPSWDFDDMLEHDIPQAINYVLQNSLVDPKTNKKPTQLHYIGHSMGGILLLSYLSLSPEHFSQFRSAITVGTAMSYANSGSHYTKLLPFRKIARYIENVMLPNGPANILLSYFIVWFPNPILNFQVCLENVGSGTALKIFRYALHSIPVRLLIHLSSAIANVKGVTNRKGDIFYLESLEKLCRERNSHKKYLPPILMVGGDKDYQCPPLAVLNTHKELSECYPNMKTEMFGRSYGDSYSYGHFDLLIGRKVNVEVFPVIEKWISEAE